MHGRMNDIQLDTIAYVGVNTRAQVGYLGGFSVATDSSGGRCNPSDIGRKLTSTAKSQIKAIVTMATFLVTHRPYLTTKR